MLTYPRFAKTCYASFAVAVVAALLKLSVSGAQPALLKVLPAVPTASAVEPAATSPDGFEDPRLGSFSGDDGSERTRANLSRSASREEDSDGSDEEATADASVDASVFRRPSLDGGSSSEPACGDLGDVPRNNRVVFPLPEEYFNSYDDTWGAARPQGGHEGSDLMSPTGTPEFALTDGRLVAVAGSNENGWNRLGGYTVMLEAAYDVGPIKKGDLFYYAHMDQKSSLPVGTEVRAGQRIGVVGDTGEGPEVTRGKFPPHLHLGWYDANLSEERSEAESGAMNPYPLLLWLEENGGAVSGGTDASYCQAPQSPNPAPSTGEPDWPVPSSPSVRPDLDTGSAAASPSPAIREDKPHENRSHEDRPERDGDRNRKEGKDKGAADAAEGVENEKLEQAPEKPKKESFRKKIEAKKADLPRDPAPKFDRTTPEERDEAHRNDVRGEGPKNGGQDGKKREEDRPAAPRSIRDRPEGEQEAAPSEEAPKPPAPVPDAPDRQPRPVPAKPNEGPDPENEPEPTAPPAPEQEVPVTKPEPVPHDAVGGEPTPPGTASPEGVDVPSGEGAVPSVPGAGTAPASDLGIEE